MYETEIFWLFIALALVLSLLAIGLVIRKARRIREVKRQKKELEQPPVMPPPQQQPTPQQRQRERSRAVSLRARIAYYFSAIRKPRGKGRTEVEPAREPLPVRWVSKKEFARRTAIQLAQTIKDYIPKAALPISSYRFAAEHVFYVFLSIPVAVAAPFLAYFLHPVFLALLFVPLLVFVMPWLRLKSAVGDYRRATDAELPFFTVHAAVSQSAGLNIFESLCSTIGKGIFRQIERAALLARRYFRVLGLSPMSAIEKLGREHPHQGMRQLLLGYTSEFYSGGNVSSFLEAKADEHLRLTRYRYDRYAKDVGTIMEIILTTLLIVPTMLLMGLFLVPEGIVTLGIGFLSLGIPIVLASCYSMIRAMQPRDYTEYSSSLPLALGLAALTFFALIFFSFWMAVSLSVGVGCLVYGIPVALQRREVSAHERSLPQFLRDVTEFQKLNYPITKAIARLRKNPAYAPSFRRLLEEVTKKIALGYRLAEIDVRSRSWLTRMAFFHLGQIAESGGLSPKSTELLTEFITRVKEARDETRRTVSMHRMISLATPLILAVISGLMMGTLSGISAPQTGEAVGSALGALISPPPVFAEMSYAVILFSSIGVAFLSAYATDYTAKNTIWVALSAFLGAAAISLIPVFSSLVMSIIF
ncbi:MAG: type II secretion system F family protein [Hadesarchaea archaeon]|nr:type II secretion system F family protein [Hadesarchaea archaeon]